MILCPNCREAQVSGALFCSECGFKLTKTEIYREPEPVIEPSSIPAEEQEDESPAPAVDSFTESSAPSDEPNDPTKGKAVMTLHLLDAGKDIVLSGGTEFAIGRSQRGQPIVPEVDLGSYQAFQYGVSRLHASLKVTEKGIMISDMGSPNGTRVNNHKIKPLTDYPVSDGDIVSLGRLQFKVKIHKPTG